MIGCPSSTTILYYHPLLPSSRWLRLLPPPAGLRIALRPSQATHTRPHRHRACRAAGRRGGDAAGVARHRARAQRAQAGRAAATGPPGDRRGRRRVARGERRGGAVGGRRAHPRVPGPTHGVHGGVSRPPLHCNGERGGRRPNIFAHWVRS